MSLVFEQVVVMFLLMLAGAGAYRVHLISDEGSRQLTQLLLYLCNPALMISSLALPFDVQLQAGRAGGGVSVIVVLAALISARLMFPGGQGVEQFGVAFCNAGFIGIPLVSPAVGRGFSVLFNDLFNGHAAVCLDGRTDADHWRCRGNPLA